MKRIVFLTGAGISAESGIRTFRDSDGLWEQYPVEEVASIEGYYRNPGLVLDFYNARRRQLLEVEPNEAHRLVAALEAEYEVIVVTQNVDDLHERGGSSHIIHLHGELLKACSSREPNDSRYIESVAADRRICLGDKAGDGSQLRPYIVWFGEDVPKIESAAAVISQTDILVIVGTSLNVYPAAGLLHYAPQHAEVYLIDPNPVKVHSLHPIQAIAKGAVAGMQELYERLTC
jgi:NAD-dependent deacetylase